MLSLNQKVITTVAPGAVILIRLVVGGVFLSEGIQKFLFADENGVGRFAKIGIPSPEIMAPFVGVVVWRVDTGWISYTCCCCPPRD